MHKLTYRLNQISRWEDPLCLRFNRASRVKWLRGLFRMVSRLGDGVFWYVLMLVLLGWYGKGALQAVGHMALAGVICVLLYKWLKRKTSRPRPFQVNQSILLGAHPLDPFSFPSGHTLHAVAFTIVALSYFPALAWVVVPFTALVALSRLVLGLHYPSDVLAGALIGTLVAVVSFLVA